MLGRAVFTPALSHHSPRDSREPAARHDVVERFRRVRARTAELCEPLLTEDFAVQSMPDASPVKWHLAHTTWFFERFILEPYFHGYSPPHPLYGHLFNSYYKTVGDPWERSRRGLLSRPTVDEVYRYRMHVEENLLDLLAKMHTHSSGEVLRRLELGIQHEQQHQELILTDVLHLFGSNPLRPAYRASDASTHPKAPRSATHELRWVAHEGGLVQIGHAPGDAFGYDNEMPRHSVFLAPFELGSRLVTQAEYLEFIEDGGYTDPRHWLSEGWDLVCREKWQAPLYWEKQGRSWSRMTLSGMLPVAGEEPVCHVSYFEADAFARWKGARLPNEAEWEIAAASRPVEGNFAESGALMPLPAEAGTPEHPVQQLYGDCWEWTASAYLPYPGFRPLAGELGEYNGKFMCNQMVLRGGSCASPASHLRAAYRNYFPPAARWQFMGIRLAR